MLSYNKIKQRLIILKRAQWSVGEILTVESVSGSAQGYAEKLPDHIRKKNIRSTD